MNFCMIFRMPENDIDAMETLVKENHLLKQQLQNCFTKVAKTQKVRIHLNSKPSTVEMSYIICSFVSA